MLPLKLQRTNFADDCTEEYFIHEENVFVKGKKYFMTIILYCMVPSETIKTIRAKIIVKLYCTRLVDFKLPRKVSQA
jgi:hypothetical protein